MRIWLAVVPLFGAQPSQARVEAPIVFKGFNKVAVVSVVTGEGTAVSISTVIKCKLSTPCAYHPHPPSLDINSAHVAPSEIHPPQPRPGILDFRYYTGQGSFPSLMQSPAHFHGL